MSVTLAFAFAAMAAHGSAILQRRMEEVTGSRVARARAARPSEASARNDHDRARQVMAAFARCSLDRSSATTIRLLSGPMDDAYADGIRRLVSEDCLMSGSLRFAPQLLRGALFTELWGRRTVAETKGRAWNLTIPPFDPSAGAGASGPAQLHRSMMVFAACIANRDRTAASDFVMAGEGTQAEATTLRRLTPQLGPCLPAGSKLTLNRSTLKGPLAEALYRQPASSLTASPADQPKVKN